MNAQSSIQAFTDAAADAVGREIARLRLEARREEEIRQAEYRARCAELDSRILAVASLEKEVRDRLATLKDGEPGRPGKDADPVKDGEPGQPGKDGLSVEDIAVTQTDDIVTFGFTVGDVRDEFDVKLPEGPPGDPGEPGKEGPPGKLSAVQPWADEVHYEGAIRTHLGATWQALKDTAKEPPSEDWACIAERGKDGDDGQGFSLRGTWSADEEYKPLDVVMCNGASFAARIDNPGECPGPNWKLFAGRGKSGKPGDTGKRGEQGPPGPPVKAMEIDDNAILTLTNADGSVVQCDLYPLLSKLDRKGL